MSKSPPTIIEDEIRELSRQIEDLTKIVLSQREPSLKFCLTVEELAQRWQLGAEAVRRLVRERKMKPLRGFRPYRFTIDEIKRYEALDDRLDTRSLLKGGRR